MYFKNQAIKNGASEEQIKLFEDTISFIQDEKKRQGKEEHKKARNEILEQIKPGLVKPNDLKGDKTVKIGNKHGHIEERPIFDRFHGHELLFHYRTKNGKEKVKNLGKTFNQSYDLKYDEWLVNIINENRIKVV